MLVLPEALFHIVNRVNWLLKIPLKLVLIRTWLTVQTVPLQVSVAEERVPLVSTELELSIEGSLGLSILAVCETLPILWSCWTCSRFLCLLKSSKSLMLDIGLLYFDNMKLLMFLLHGKLLKYVPLRWPKVAILKWPVPLADSAELILEESAISEYTVGF